MIMVMLAVSKESGALQRFWPPDLAALAVPVVVWPDRDDSGAPRGAARAGAAARSTAHGSDAAAGRTCSRAL